MCDGGHTSPDIDTPKSVRHKHHTDGQILHNVILTVATHPFGSIQAFGQSKLSLVRLLFMKPEMTEESFSAWWCSYIHPSYTSISSIETAAGGRIP